MCHCRQPANYFSLITFDASLTGAGATLQSGLKTVEEAAIKPIISYWHAHWSDRDLATVKATRGEARGQAVLEAYALLLSVSTWAKILEQAQGALHIRGNALGVLQNMLRFKAKVEVTRSGSCIV